MKLLFLADPNSPHIIKWSRGLANKGFTIKILGLSKLQTKAYDNQAGVSVVNFDFERSFLERDSGSLSKYKYLRVLLTIRKIIKEFQPDILHAHFATSYGLLAALTRFQTKVLSVWGSDVYDFPKRSFFHRMILKFNLSSADKIFSTSNTMAVEIKKYTKKKVDVIPFGIDFEKFKPQSAEKDFSTEEIIIGSLKKLEYKYGLKYLIEAFGILIERHKNLPLKLMIAGRGNEEESLRELVLKLGIKEKVNFIGEIEYDEIEKYHNMISINAVTSLRESFGVSIIEASACEKPVVATDVGGLPEVVQNNVTGILVKEKDPEDIANALERLVLDRALRETMGKNGRKRAMQLFNFDDNLNSAIEKYNELNSDAVR